MFNIICKFIPGLKGPKGKMMQVLIRQHILNDSAEEIRRLCTKVCMTYLNYIEN